MIDGIKYKWSEIPYGIADLKPDAALRYSSKSKDSLVYGDSLQCCIRNCQELIPKRHRGQGKQFCLEHGISMSTKPTYVYEDAKRNFIIANHIPTGLSKVEKWRLGFETSEDALSWNVFVGLYALQGLTEAFEKLTGTYATDEPELYMWGNRIGPDTGKWQWQGLLDVRKQLEGDLNLPTEPDIMLRVPRQAVVLIEAKFGSPNSSLDKKVGRFGSAEKFLKRYRCKPGAAGVLNTKWISEQTSDRILEQLCRNAVFAHWLALEGEQAFVINLVTRRARNNELAFRQHLAGDGVQFHVRNWEDLFGLPIIQGEQASVLRRYLKNKTLNLLPAFVT